MKIKGTGVVNLTDWTLDTIDDVSNSIEQTVQKIPELFSDTPAMIEKYVIKAASEALAHAMRDEASVWLNGGTIQFKLGLAGELQDIEWNADIGKLLAEELDMMSSPRDNKIIGSEEIDAAKSLRATFANFVAMIDERLGTP